MATSKRINSESVVDLIFHLKWRSSRAGHTDALQASQINIWRDVLPPVLVKRLMNREAGERLQVRLEDGDAVSAYDAGNFLDIRQNQFDRRFRPESTTEPRLGRFYPKGMLKNVNGIFKANVQPFRCVGINNGHIKVDFNHPLAGKEIDLSAVVGKVAKKDVERGGTSVDWMERLLSGPGMQARWEQQRTDYFSDDAFRRLDERADTEFYQNPRLVSHIDSTAREMVKNTYGRFLTDGMQVLDLMGSWQSHLPEKNRFKRLVGLGLNQAELAKNPRLTEFIVQDLNNDPTLSFNDNSFDAVVNTVSIEYLTNPLAVFNEILRVLKPNGYLVVTFSNRWFPTKAINIWPELHEFERMGLVLELFLRSGGFEGLQTYSIRGLPRPHDDPYYPDLPFSDPVYAVWGRKALAV